MSEVDGDLGTLIVVCSFVGDSFSVIFSSSGFFVPLVVVFKEILIDSVDSNSPVVVVVVVAAFVVSGGSDRVVEMFLS